MKASYTILVSSLYMAYRDSRVETRRYLLAVVDNNHKKDDDLDFICNGGDEDKRTDMRHVFEGTR